MTGEPLNGQTEPATASGHPTRHPPPYPAREAGYSHQ